MCLGIADQLISSIQEYGSDAIVFVCTDCCTNSNNGGNMADTAFKLFQTVKELCETVQALFSNVSSLC